MNNRPSFLRTLSVIAAVLTCIRIMMNIILVLNPHIAAVILGYGSIKELMDTKLSARTQNLMLVQAVTPALLLILCGISCFSDKLNKNKSLLMLILIPSAYIATAVFTSFIYTIAISSAVAEGMNTVQLLSSITTIRSFLSHLYIFSFVILMCSVSVEHYIAKTNE